MKDIPIRLYDCPGISNEEHDTMDLDVLEAVINGHIKGDSKVLLKPIMHSLLMLHL